MDVISYIFLQRLVRISIYLENGRYMQTCTFSYVIWVCGGGSTGPVWWSAFVSAIESVCLSALLSISRLLSQGHPIAHTTGARPTASTFTVLDVSCSLAAQSLNTAYVTSRTDTLNGKGSSCVIRKEPEVFHNYILKLTAASCMKTKSGPMSFLFFR